LSSNAGISGSRQSVQNGGDDTNTGGNTNTNNNRRFQRNPDDPFADPIRGNNVTRNQTGDNTFSNSSNANNNNSMGRSSGSSTANNNSTGAGSASRRSSGASVQNTDGNTNSNRQFQRSPDDPFADPIRGNNMTRQTGDNTFSNSSTANNNNSTGRSTSSNSANRRASATSVQNTDDNGTSNRNSNRRFQRNPGDPFADPIRGNNTNQNQTGQNGFSNSTDSSNNNSTGQSNSRGQSATGFNNRNTLADRTGLGFSNSGRSLALKDVTSGSLAERAGFESGDRILSIDGQDLSNFRDLSRFLSQNNSGNVDVLVDRNGEEETISLNLADIAGAMQGTSRSGRQGSDRSRLTRQRDFQVDGSQ